MLLKNAILAIAIGLGIFLGQILDRIGMIGNPAATFSMILICGGAAVIAYHLILPQKFPHLFGLQEEKSGDQYDDYYRNQDDFGLEDDKDLV